MSPKGETNGSETAKMWIQLCRDRLRWPVCTADPALWIPPDSVHSTFSQTIEEVSRTPDQHHFRRSVIALFYSRKAGTPYFSHCRNIVNPYRGAKTDCRVS